MKRPRGGDPQQYDRPAHEMERSRKDFAGMVIRRMSRSIFSFSMRNFTATDGG